MLFLLFFFSEYHLLIAKSVEEQRKNSREKSRLNFYKLYGGIRRMHAFGSITQSFFESYFLRAGLFSYRLPRKYRALLPSQFDFFPLLHTL